MKCYLNKTDIKLLNVFYSFFLFYSETYPPQTFLAEKVGVSVRQIKRSIKKLTSLGLISVKRDNQDKGSHRNNLYSLGQNKKCPLECPLECPLDIINNNKLYNPYYSNKDYILYNNLGFAQTIHQKQNKEDKDMDIRKKHLNFLLEKDMTKIQSEYVFKLFYLLCDEYGFKIPYSFLKKDIGIIRKFQKSFKDDKELKDFFKFVISNWLSLIYKFKIASTVPDIRIINLKFNELYNEFQNTNKEQKNDTTKSKYIKK